MVEAESRKVLKSKNDIGHILPLESRQIEDGNRLKMFDYCYII